MVSKQLAILGYSDYSHNSGHYPNVEVLLTFLLCLTPDVQYALWLVVRYCPFTLVI